MGLNKEGSTRHITVLLAEKNSNTNPICLFLLNGEKVKRHLLRRNYINILQLRVKARGISDVLTSDISL